MRYALAVALCGASMLVGLLPTFGLDVRAGATGSMGSFDDGVRLGHRMSVFADRAMRRDVDSSFVLGVNHVVFPRSKGEMGRIDTGSVVAGMHYVQAIGNWANVMPIRNAMGFIDMPTNRHAWVVGLGVPDPARAYNMNVERDPCPNVVGGCGAMVFGGVSILPPHAVVGVTPATSLSWLSASGDGTCMSHAVIIPDSSPKYHD